MNRNGASTEYGAVAQGAAQGIFVPLLGHARPDGVAVPVDRQHFLTIADAADEVAHRIDSNVVVVEREHLLIYPVDHSALITAVRRDGDDLAKEGEEGGSK